MMTEAEIKLCSLADEIVREILLEGRQQGHTPDSFSTRHQDYHLDRAIRHVMSARLMREGHAAPDAEGYRGHMRRALTRLVMAISVE